MVMAAPATIAAWGSATVPEIALLVPCPRAQAPQKTIPIRAEIMSRMLRIFFLLLGDHRRMKDDGAAGTIILHPFLVVRRGATRRRGLVPSPSPAPLEAGAARAWRGALYAPSCISTGSGSCRERSPGSTRRARNAAYAHPPSDPRPPTGTAPRRVPAPGFLPRSSARPPRRPAWAG